MLVILVILLAGCSGMAESSPIAARGLRTVEIGPADGTPDACGGVGVAAVLRGDPADPRLTWLEPLQGGRRIDTVWPAGSVARFATRLQVFDARGQLMIEGGDFVNGGCVTEEPDVLLLEPPFLALRLDCGPIAIDDCAFGRIYAVATSNGWPERAIAEVRFITNDGRYRLVYEDGSEVTGTSSAP
jgi:hypothetical protein